MSYTIDFLKLKIININSVYDLLESDVKSSDSHFIDKKLMKDLVSEFNNINKEYRAIEDEDSFELNFPTFQISMYHSEIAISIPFWDKNSNDKNSYEIKRIINILLENGFTGFDSQTENFINKPYKIKNTFIELKEEINIPNKQKTDSSSIQYVGVIFLLLLSIFITYKIFKR